jgi:hypothetical protein
MPLTAKGEEIKGALTETEKAYIAGIIDGEGSIVLGRRNTGCKDTVYPHVSVGNTNEALLSWLRAKVGSGYWTAYKGGKPGWKPQTHWGVTSAKAYALLVEIRPYLILKGRQADVVIALWEENAAAVALTGKNKFSVTNRVPQWLRHFRNACFLYVLDLNRRGTAGNQNGKEVTAHLRAMEECENAA